MKKDLFIYGASGHAKVVIDIVEQCGEYQISHIFDDDPDKNGADFYGYRITGGRESFEEALTEKSIETGFIAIGDNTTRKQISDMCREKHLELISIIHPSAIMSRTVSIGSDCVIMPGVVINADVIIKPDTIINTSSSIDHDCVIGSSVHIAVGAHLCGNVKIGDLALIGAGAVVNPNLTVGNQTIIGSGAVVVDNIGDNQKAIGVPAKPI